MVLVVAMSLDVEVHLRSIAEALEEMQEHLGGHIPYPLAMELGMPLQPGASAEVECHGAQTVVHRQRVAIALDATLGAQRLQQTAAQREGGILDGVVLVDMQVALGADGQVDAAMLAYLLEHVVEEAQPRADVGMAIAIEVDTHQHIGLVGDTMDLCRTLLADDQLGHLVPRQPVAPQDERTAPHVSSQLGVGIAVANDDARTHVVGRIVHVLLDHAGARLAHG